MKDLGVPCVPGSDGGVPTLEDAKRIGDEIGYPVIIKATAGGGGRGMKVAKSADEMEQAFMTARAEGKAAFGNDEVYIEKYLTTPRHIEIQVFGDGKGKAVHLGRTRLFIATPSPKGFRRGTRPLYQLKKNARVLVKSVPTPLPRSITSAPGTIEFLYENGEFYFIEMNTRLQVEHPVTEGDFWRGFGARTNQSCQWSTPIV